MSDLIQSLENDQDNSFFCRNILLVEDSDEDYEAFSRIMLKSSLSYPVFRCLDGDEALEFLYRTGDYSDSTIAPRPALILLDLNLPGTDGREVLAQIKQDESLCKIPVVVLTTSSNPKDIAICYRRGVNGYVIKPINTGKLRESVQAIINYWLKAVTLPDQISEDEWNAINELF